MEPGLIMITSNIYHNLLILLPAEPDQSDHLCRAAPLLRVRLPPITQII
jgi:hypothetical protein